MVPVLPYEVSRQLQLVNSFQNTRHKLKKKKKGILQKRGEKINCAILIPHMIFKMCLFCSTKEFNDECYKCSYNTQTFYSKDLPKQAIERKHKM